MEDVQLSDSSMSSLGRTHDNNDNNNERDDEGGLETYNDNSIEITSNELIIHRYYFPSLKSKAIRLEDIEWAKVGAETNLKWIHMRVSGLAYYRSGLWIWWNAKTRIVNKLGGRWGMRSMEDIRNTTMLVKIRGSKLVAGVYVKYPAVAAPIIQEALTRNHMHNE
ncbi:hypothetical protein EV175_003225 [Coemansia sp. RSA 1933]|nr:hypothetical protein EV175_003225 [Coemansia sp. RSA 1933]